jgi:hypothetical protein
MGSGRLAKLGSAVSELEALNLVLETLTAGT